MRIIGGRYRGRVLRSFPGREIRPTSDRLRQSLFNILQGRLEGAVVWDAFAGTGALGLEALSRGASHVTFTENSRSALNVLRKNTEILDAPESVAVIEGDAICWARQTKGRFDLIFVDPPYDFGRYGELAEAFCNSAICGPDSLVMIEHSDRSEEARRMAEVFQPHRQVRQGNTIVSFFTGAVFTSPQQAG